MFNVWAPVAASVELALNGERIAMTRGADGSWTADRAAPDGAGYGFRLDGAPPLPDPRSPWQPDGPHALSRAVDQTFPWTDHGWQAPQIGGALIYELHVGTFTPEGTFESAISKLDHLKALGVTHVELMPVAEFEGDRGWGYDGVDLYAPHHGYGGPAGLKKLVDACHGRGLAAILDVVYNHLGPSGNYLGRFAPYFTQSYSTPWGVAYNYDGPDSDPIRRFICDNALMWLRDYHFDGLRLDDIDAIIDTSAVPIVEQLAAEVSELSAHLGRRLVVIAECNRNDPRVVQPREAGGFGLDAQWSDEFHHALHSVMTGERNGYYVDYGRLADLAYTLEHVYRLDGRYSLNRRRTHGRPVIGLSGHRFLGYMQTHDQVANRSGSLRMSRLVSPDRVRAGAALVLTSPFVPMLFQGEEWGAGTPFYFFTDYRDPELGRAVRDGRREQLAALGWDPALVPDPQARETFESSRLDWSEPGRSPHSAMLAWYRDLIALRRSVPSLTDGRLDRLRVDFSEENRWIAVHRGDVSIACNFHPRAQWVPLASDRRHMLLASQTGIQTAPDGIVLPPDCAAIVG